MEAICQQNTLGTILVTGGNGVVGSRVVDAVPADCRPVAPSKIQHHANYLATKQILEAARQHHSIRAVVYKSSVEAVVLGPGFNRQPQTEEEATLNGLKSGTSAYARTIGTADALTHFENCDGNYQGMLLTTCLRIGVLYGERDEKTTAEILKLVNTFGARVQIGPNNAVHDWVYTQNAALANVLAAKALLRETSQAIDLGINGEAFYITDGGPMLFWDFPSTRIIKVPFGVVLFFAAVGERTYNIFTFRRKTLKMSPHHLDFTRKGYWFSIDKARVRLGYKPIRDTDEGIRRSVTWFR
ncbi:NAD(P)-binding protein [Lindgomyces ingoldianus]|uniref:NAD(P)-binding protein n=1 Tax=Lindgomyces ingoldianus TaxID=673940 RepID=A0ACB6RGJ4_9PLEO|nr:NAD(P)-binding protein [Lindgomyces ingoldianus]KAF2478408.1 NAD(P)-binding protein [Lindgomyces ingoldianus]